jgi:uncharacterized protein involved in exopolysaccharide biosynthesis
MDERISLGQLARMLFKNRKMILVATLGTMAVAVAVSLVLPQWFRAKATILPPESVVSTPDIVGIMRFAGVKPTQLPTVATESDVYSAILRSNTVAEAVIDSLDLIKAYKAKKPADALERVLENTKVTVAPEGIVEITYEDRDRARAAAVANAFVHELDRFNRETNVTSAGRVRMMVEKRLAETRSELNKAEDDLRAFKETTGAIFISDQATASIKAAADMYARIAALEVELARLKQYATDRSPEVIDLRLQIGTIQGKLGEMGYLRGGSAGAVGSYIFPRFDAAPGLEQKLAGLTLEVEIKRSVYTALSSQYEQARIQEAKDTPTVQVLDRAQPPPTRSKPKRKALVGVSTVAAFLLSSALALYRETRREVGGRG